MEHDVSRSCVVLGPTSWRCLQAYSISTTQDWGQNGFERVHAGWRLLVLSGYPHEVGLNRTTYPNIIFIRQHSDIIERVSKHLFTMRSLHGHHPTGKHHWNRLEWRKAELILSDLDRRLSSIAFMTCRGRVSSGGSLGRLDDCLSWLAGEGMYQTCHQKNRKKHKVSYLIIFDADLMICWLLCKHEIPFHYHPHASSKYISFPFRRTLVMGLARTF